MRRPLVRIASAALGFFLLASFAPAQQRKENSAPQHKTEAHGEAPLPAQITLLETKVRFEANGDSRKEVHAVVKINNEIGVSQFAHLNFDFNRSFQSVDIPMVRITHPGGGTADILPSAITDHPNPAVVNAPAYQDVRVKSVRILGLGPADMLEYRVITTTTHPPLAPDFWFQHSFDRTGVVSHEILDLDLPVPRLRIRTNPKTPPTIARSGEADTARTTYHWDLESAKLPTEKEGHADLDVSLTTFSSWSGLTSRLRKREDTGFSTAIYAEADQRLGGIGGNESPASLYRLVSRKIATLDLPLDLSLPIIRGAQQILESGYGTPEEKVRLLQVLVSQNNAATTLLLYGRGNHLEQELPNPPLLTGALLELTEGGQHYFLDPGLEVAPFGVVSADLRGQKALAVAPSTSDADDNFVEISRTLPFASRQSVAINATISEKGELRVKTKYTLRGDNELLLRVAFHQTPKDKWDGVAQLLALSDGFRGKVTNTIASDPYETADPFTVEYEITQPKFLDWSKQPLRVPALLPLLGLPDPAKASMAATSAPIELGTPLDVEVSATVHLPPGTSARIPAGTSVARDFATYSSHYSADAATLTASRHINFILREIPADRALEYNSFLRAVQNDESQVFILDRAAEPAKPEPNKP